LGLLQIECATKGLHLEAVYIRIPYQPSDTAAKVKNEAPGHKKNKAANKAEAVHRAQGQVNEKLQDLLGVAKKC